MILTSKKIGNFLLVEDNPTPPYVPSGLKHLEGKSTCNKSHITMALSWVKFLRIRALSQDYGVCHKVNMCCSRYGSGS